MTRHAKNVKGMLEQNELALSRELGYEALSEFVFDVVITSPLPRAIHTAFAIVTGQMALNEERGLLAPGLWPVMPEFGSDAMFGEMTAPEGFRGRAAQVGNCTALWELHPEQKVRSWQKAMMDALEQVADNMHGDATVLHVSHSPCIELTLQGFAERNNFLLPEGAYNIKELESVVVEFAQEQEGEKFVIKSAKKILAPEA